MQLLHGENRAKRDLPRPIVQIELPYFQWERNNISNRCKSSHGFGFPARKTSAESSYDFRIGKKLFIYHSTSFFSLYFQTDD